MSTKTDTKAKGGSAATSDFGASLSSWRKFNGIKQEAIAEMLGVSQASVAYWERGQSMPNTQRLSKIKDLMMSSQMDEIALERAFIQRQASVRALLRLDDLTLFAVSAGFRRVWPNFSDLIGKSLLDKLTNESAMLRFNDDLYYAARSGALSLISGASLSHTSLNIDAVVPHEWHICVRRYAGGHFIEIEHSPCDPSTPIGVKELVSADGLVSPIKIMS